MILFAISEQNQTDTRGRSGSEFSALCLSQVLFIARGKEVRCGETEAGEDIPHQTTYLCSGDLRLCVGGEKTLPKLCQAQKCQQQP